MKKIAWLLLLVCIGTTPRMVAMDDRDSSSDSNKIVYSPKALRKLGATQGDITKNKPLRRKKSTSLDSTGRKLSGSRSLINLGAALPKNKVPVPGSSLVVPGAQGVPGLDLKAKSKSPRKTWFSGFKSRTNNFGGRKTRRRGNTIARPSLLREDSSETIGGSILKELITSSEAILKRYSSDELTPDDIALKQYALNTKATLGKVHQDNPEIFAQYAQACHDYANETSVSWRIIAKYFLMQDQFLLDLIAEEKPLPSDLSAVPSLAKRYAELQGQHHLQRIIAQLGILSVSGNFFGGDLPKVFQNDPRVLKPKQQSLEKEISLLKALQDDVSLADLIASKEVELKNVAAQLPSSKVLHAPLVHTPESFVKASTPGNPPPMLSQTSPVITKSADPYSSSDDDSDIE